MGGKLEILPETFEIPTIVKKRLLPNTSLSGSKFVVRLALSCKSLSMMENKIVQSINEAHQQKMGRHVI